MAKLQKGKKILKGKTQRNWFFTGFFISGGVLLVSWLGLKVDLIVNHYFPFNITDFFGIAGFIFFWMGLVGMVSYITVYEKGIKVRKNGVFNYIKTKFIFYSEISDIHLRRGRYPDLIIQLEDEEIVFPTILTKNYREIGREILKRVPQDKWGKNVKAFSKEKIKPKVRIKSKQPQNIPHKVDFITNVVVFSLLGYNYLILFLTFVILLLPIFQILIILVCVTFELLILRYFWRNIKVRIDTIKTTSMAQALLDSISNDEVVLYKSDRLSNKKVVYITVYSVGACTIIAIFIAILLIVPDIHNTLDFIISIVIFFLTLFPMFLIVSGLVTRTLYNDMLAEVNFLITDKSIHIAKQKPKKNFKVGSPIKLSKINAYRFYKRSLDNKGDRGSIIIFYNNYLVSLKLINIPDFSTFQKTFESIIFNYSGIVLKSKGEEVTLDLNFPIQYQISTEELNLIKKYTKKTILNNIWIFIISFIACLLLAIYFFSSIPILFFVFITITITALILLTGLLTLIRIAWIKKRTNKKEDILSLYPNYMILKNDGEIKKIIFNSNMCLDFIKINTLGKKPKERFDTVIIKERFDSKSKISFGPIDNFSARLKVILSNILIWKIQNKFLLKKMI